MAAGTTAWSAGDAELAGLLQENATAEIRCLALLRLKRGPHGTRGSRANEGGDMDSVSPRDEEVYEAIRTSYRAGYCDAKVEQGQVSPRDALRELMLQLDQFEYCPTPNDDSSVYDFPAFKAARTAARHALAAHSVSPREDWHFHEWKSPRPGVTECYCGKRVSVASMEPFDETKERYTPEEQRLMARDEAIRQGSVAISDGVTVGAQQPPREPDGYIYEYEGHSGIVRLLTYGKFNGAEPLRSIPYWLAPQQPPEPDEETVDEATRRHVFIQAEAFRKRGVEITATSIKFAHVVAATALRAAQQPVADAPQPITHFWQHGEKTATLFENSRVADGRADALPLLREVIDSFKAINEPDGGQRFATAWKSADAYLAQLPKRN